MSTLPDPTPEEDEAFEAIENASKRSFTVKGEVWIWLPEGEYSETQLRQLVNSFDLMKKAV